MPTVLLILGWRLFFYANKRDEPIHIHCQKGDAEDYIVSEWNRFQKEKRGKSPQD
jgi:hypothetical protein